jgi:hypothetical protein
MNWVTRVRNAIPFIAKRETAETLWHKCKGCNTMIFLKEYEENQSVCPKCDFHGRIGPAERFAAIFDADSFTVLPMPRVVEDPLKFKDSKKYPDRIKAARAATGEQDAMISARGTDRWPCRRRQRAGFRLHGRIDGDGGGRSLYRRRAGSAEGQMPLYHLHRRWRRAHAGRHSQPDADAAHHGGDPDAARRGAALYRRADRSDHWRRYCQSMRCWAISRLPNPARLSALPDSA